MLALAAAATAFRSSAVRRTCTVRPLASPFGSFGRPTLLALLCWLKASKLLYDCCFYRVLCALDGMRVQYGDMTPWMLRIVSIMRPRIDPERCGMAFEIEYLDNPFPHRFSLECFLHWNAFNVRSIRAMYAPDYVAQFF